MIAPMSFDRWMRSNVQKKSKFPWWFSAFLVLVKYYYRYFYSVILGGFNKRWQRSEFLNEIIDLAQLQTMTKDTGFHQIDYIAGALLFH